MQKANLVPHWTRVASPLPFRPPQTSLKSYRQKSPWTSHCVFLWKNIVTNQILYTSRQYLDEDQARDQLTYYGKKTVPAEIRKDLWRPYATVAIPIPKLLGKNGKRQYTQLDALRISKLAKFTLLKLLHLRMLRDYAWRKPGEPLAVSEERINRTDFKFNSYPLYQLPKAKKRTIGRRETKRDMKDRQKWLMHQRGSSVADVATAIKHLNAFVLEKSTFQPLEGRSLNYRVRTPWRKGKTFVYSNFIKHEFLQLVILASQSTYSRLQKMQFEIDRLTSLQTKTSTVQERAIILKLRQRKNRILRARAAFESFRSTLSPHVMQNKYCKIISQSSLPLGLKSLTLSTPLKYLIHEIKALYSKKTYMETPWTEEQLTEILPIHVFWADLFDRKYTDTWADNTFHHWMGNRSGADLVRGAVPSFSPTSQTVNDLVELKERTVKIKPHPAEAKLSEAQLADLNLRLARLLPQLLYLREQSEIKDKEFEFYKSLGPLVESLIKTSEDKESQVAEIEKVKTIYKSIFADLTDLKTSLELQCQAYIQKTEVSVQEQASRLSKHQVNRRDLIKLDYYLANLTLNAFRRVNQRLERETLRTFLEAWNGDAETLKSKLPYVRTLSAEIRRLLPLLSNEDQKLKRQAAKTLQEKMAIGAQIEDVKTAMQEASEPFQVKLEVFQGNEGVNDDIDVIDSGKGRSLENTDEDQDEDNEQHGQSLPPPPPASILNHVPAVDKKPHALIGRWMPAIPNIISPVKSYLFNR